MTDETKMYGMAIFGTSDGLEIKGNGILSHRFLQPGILEFSSGRDRNGALHAKSVKNPTLFRRKVERQDGFRYDIIGYVSACLDRHNRKGFFGACVAVDSTQLSPEPQYVSWGSPLEVVQNLYEQLLNYIGSDQVFFIPTDDSLITSSVDSNVGLKSLSKSEKYFYWTAKDSMEDFNILSLAPNLAGETLMMFQEPVNGAVALADTQAERDRLVSLINKGLASAVTPRQTLDEVDPPTKHGALIRRIDALEQRLYSLERQQTSSYAANSSRTPIDLKLRSFDLGDQPTFFEEAMNVLRSPLFWLATVVLVIVVAVVIYFILNLVH